jgi:molybdate transport system substrate-binding protein
MKMPDAISMTQRNAWCRLGLALALLATVAGARADDVSVAVAANFRAPMESIAPEFKRLTGHNIVASYGSTGKFYAQIRNGAPFEVLLAADDKTPARLEQEGAGIAGTRFTYAIGTLALWSPKPGVVDIRGDILRRSAGSNPDGAAGGTADGTAGVAHIALADPHLAPYGAAAVQALQKLGLYESLQPRIVTGEDINQAYQFVASGNADVGFVALSQITREGELTGGSAWIVPRNLYAPIRQDAIVLAPGRDKPAALALLQFLRGDWARARMVSFGYAAP